MRRVSAILLVLAFAACKTAPEPVKAGPARPREPTGEELVQQRLEREHRIAAWDANVQAQVERDRATRFRDCYLNEVRRVEDEAVKGAYRMGNNVPGLAGRVTLVIPIEPNGTVPSPHLEEDTLKNPKVSACLIDFVRGYKFGESPTDETLEIKVPLKFELMGGEPK